MKCAEVKIIPKLLNLEQKKRRMDIPQEMLTTFNEDADLLKQVISNDESWMYGHDIETKDQSSQWKAFCHDWGDKRTIEIAAVGDIKKRVSIVLRGLEKKNAGLSELYLRGGYFEGDKIVIDK